MKKRRNKKKISIVSVLPPNENTSKSQKNSVDHCRKKKRLMMVLDCRCYHVNKRARSDLKLA
jgi:hypothetical protein